MEINPPSTLKSARARSAMLRFTALLALVLLVAVIGGLAWVVQNLPRFQKPVTNKLPTPPTAKLVEFPRVIAQWDTPKADDKKEDYQAKEFEYGREGFYDFPFKNVSGKEIEVLRYATTCDCTSVRACAVSMAQWEKLAAEQSKQPGEPLTYDAAPTWVDLQTDREQGVKLDDKKLVKVQAGEAGVVRVRWAVKKAPGQLLKLTPTVFFREVGSDVTHWQSLGVPVQVGTAIRFEPARVNVGLLSPTANSVTAEFDAWSSTREKFDLKLSPVPASPFFQIETRPLSAKECADLASNLKSDKFTPRVRSGHHVKVTVYQNKDGKQLDQGPFLQKLGIDLDGVSERELPGPEIVGRVQGDIRIGGADDFGKIMFRAFRAGESAQKPVELLTDANVKLETYTHEPPWLDVKVKPNKEQLDPKKTFWRLLVTIPADTPGVRSFEEADHVTLRIVSPGSPDRFVRIAIEGSLSGQ